MVKKFVSINLVGGLVYVLSGRIDFFCVVLGDVYVCKCGFCGIVVVVFGINGWFCF